MDYILANIKEEEEDIDVETVELQPEDNRSDEIFLGCLLELTSTCDPGSLSSVANTVDRMENNEQVHIVQNDEHNLSMSLTGSVESNMVSSDYKFFSYVVLNTVD